MTLDLHLIIIILEILSVLWSGSYLCISIYLYGFNFYKTNIFILKPYNILSNGLDVITNLDNLAYKLKQIYMYVKLCAKNLPYGGTNIICPG